MPKHDDLRQSPQPLDYASGPTVPDAPPDIDPPEYGDFLIVDLLHPDWRHFFTRYRTDVIGFTVITAIVLFIILATKWLAMIGADAA